MDNSDTINYKNAISKMREITEKKEKFSFSFASYNRDNQKGGEEVFVKNAILRKNMKENDTNEVPADMYLNYIDDNDNHKRCFKHLLLSFNGLQVIVD